LANFGALKKRITFTILVLYLFSTTEFREILKLPVLFQHFNEHKQLNHHLSFFGFIYDHYNSVPHTDNDQERDNQLPFKTIDMSSFLTPAIPVSNLNNFEKAVKIIIKNDAFHYTEGYIPSPDTGKIWQPPKSISFIKV